MKQLTEPQAWRLIAERIERGQWAAGGVCWEIHRTFRAGLIDADVAAQMRRRMIEHLCGESDKRDWWNVDPQDDLDPRILNRAKRRSYFPDLFFVPGGLRTPRIMVCELLALEAEEEGL